MPYFVERPTARRVEQWDGENIDVLRDLVPGYFDTYEVDPDTNALIVGDNTYEVGSLLWNFCGLPAVLNPEDLATYWQQVNKERPAFVIDSDDVGAASLRQK
jgi:hypothetical protein